MNQLTSHQGLIMNVTCHLY